MTSVIAANQVLLGGFWITALPFVAERCLLLNTMLSVCDTLALYGVARRGPWMHGV